MGERVAFLNMPQRIPCKHCGETVTTQVRRTCTGWTCCKWFLLILFFFCCCCCICMYVPLKGAGVVVEYLECRCLHKSVVHQCKKCGRDLKIYHPDISGHKYDLKQQDKDSDSSASSYYDTEDDEEEESKDNNSVDEEEPDDKLIVTSKVE